MTPESSWLSLVPAAVAIVTAVLSRRLAINGNYHGLDHALYYSSIRDNARQRVALWWQQVGQ